MKNLLIVVDMQNDFITGALGTREAQAILPDVTALVSGWDGPVAFTRDTHTPDYLNTQEGRNLPVPHCIRDTPGWQIADPLRPFAEQAAVFDKPSFGSPELAAWCREQAPDTITLCGVCTGICVISNALLVKAALPETPVRVIAHCCACVIPQSHDTALAAMKLCQVAIED